MDVYGLHCLHHPDSFLECVDTCLTKVFAISQIMEVLCLNSIDTSKMQRKVGRTRILITVHLFKVILIRTVAGQTIVAVKASLYLVTKQLHAQDQQRKPP